MGLNVRALKGQFAGRTAAIRQESTDFLIDKGVIMAGTPDQVVAQVERFFERTGGFGHLLMMLQAGFLDHEETVRNITLFAREVYPRIRHLAGGEGDMGATQTARAGQG